MRKVNRKLVVTSVCTLAGLMLVVAAIFIVASMQRKPKPTAVWVEQCGIGVANKLTLQEITQPTVGALQVWGADVTGNDIWRIRKSMTHEMDRKSPPDIHSRLIGEFYIDRDSYLYDGFLTITYTIADWQAAKYSMPQPASNSYVVVQQKPKSKLVRFSPSKSNIPIHGIIDATKPRTIIKKNTDEPYIDSWQGVAYDDGSVNYKQGIIPSNHGIYRYSGNPVNKESEYVDISNYECVNQTPYTCIESINSLDDTLFFIGRATDPLMSSVLDYRISFYDSKEARLLACFDFGKIVSRGASVGINDMLVEASSNPASLNDIYDDAKKLSSGKIVDTGIECTVDGCVEYTYRLFRNWGIVQLAPEYGTLDPVFYARIEKYVKGSEKQNRKYDSIFSVDYESLTIEELHVPCSDQFGDNAGIIVRDHVFDNDKQRLYMSVTAYGERVRGAANTENKGYAESSIWVLDGDGEWSKLTDGASYSELSIAPDGALWFIEMSDFVKKSGFGKYSIDRVSPDLEEKKEVYSSSKRISNLLVDRSE